LKHQQVSNRILQLLSKTNLSKPKHFPNETKNSFKPKALSALTRCHEKFWLHITEDSDHSC